jgi:hypothetical protein
MPRASASVALGFSSPITRLYRYNWTQGPAAGTLSLTAHVQAGAASFKAVDAAGATVFQGLLSNGTTATAFSNAKPGPWTLQVNATAFQGDLAVAVTPSAQDASASALPSSTGTKRSPSVALPFSMALLAAVALARRRR